MQCHLCQDNISYVDYKNTQFLRRFVTSQFKIGSAIRNKLCSRHQRVIANAVKLARYMAFIPYTRNQVAK